MTLNILNIFFLYKDLNEISKLVKEKHGFDLEFKVNIK